MVWEALCGLSDPQSGEDTMENLQVTVVPLYQLWSDSDLGHFWSFLEVNGK